MIHVIATIELAPGTREAFLTEFRKIIADVRAEQGCIEYGPAVDASTELTNQTQLGPDKVVVVEKWTDLAALGRATHAGISPQSERLRARSDFTRARPSRVIMSGLCYVIPRFSNPG
jgi:quinol monooxygenase YgiN